MKRFYLLALLSLFQMGGVIYAQPTVTNNDATSISTDKYYYLRNRGRGMKYVNEHYDGYMALSSTISNYWVTYIIRFEADGDNYKVKLWNDKYLTNSGQSQAVYAGDEAILVSASYTAANQWAFKNLTNNLYFNGNDGNFVYWGGSQDAGNGSYYVEETDLTDEDFQAAVEALKVVTFNITKLDGTTTSSTGFFHAGITPVVPVDAVENLADYTFTQDGDNYNFVASSQLSTDFANAKWYNMVIRSANNYVAYSTNEPYGVNKSATRAQLASAPYQWALIGDMTNGVKMVNKETGESYTLTANGSNAVLREGQVTWDIDVNNNTVTIDGQAHKGFVMKVAGSENNYINQNGGDNGTFQFWNNGGAKNDQGSTMFFIKAPELQTYNVTYNVKYNGNTVASAVSAFEEGATIGSDIPSELNRDYVTLTPAWDASQTVNANTEVDVTATWSGPALSASVETANWQNLAIRSNWYVTSDNVDGDGALKTVNANALGLVEDAYQWALVGDPYHIQLFNKAETNNFGYSEAAQVNGGIPGFQAEPSYWTLKSSTNETVPAGSFVLNVYGTNLYINQLGGAGGSLKFWNSGANIGDAGSAFTIFDVPTNFAEYVTSEIAPYFEASGKYFVLNDAAKTASGYDEAYKTNCSYADYKSMKDKLPTILSDLSNYVLPETGYYRLKNNNYNSYMGLKATTVYGNYTAEADVNGAPTIVKLTKNEDSEYSIAIQGKYLQELTQSGNVPTADVAAFFKPGIQTPGNVSFSVSGEGHTYIHCAGEGQVVGWELNAGASLWTLEDATSINIALNAVGDGYTYATLYVPFGVTLPADGGVDAYVISTNNSNHATTVKIGKDIPAATPVILRGTATSVTATIKDAATATVGTNLLQGTYTERALGDDDVVLGKSATTGIGFYKSSATLGANKAYLDLSGSYVKSFVLDFDDDATGIEKTLSDSPLKDEGIYNLAGQRIQKMQKGLYIVNGKKVLVK